MKFNKMNWSRLLSVGAWSLTAGLIILANKYANERRQGALIQHVVYDLEHLEDGNDLITIEEIKEKVLDTYKIDLSEVKQEDLDLQTLESVLESEPFIVNADAFIDRRNELHIDISQRTPILRVMDLKGNNYYLDIEGYKLPLSKHFTARVPVVTGHVDQYEGGLDTLQSSIASAYRLVNHLRGDEFMHSWLESIQVRSNGELVMYGNLGAFEVIVGDDVDLEEKINKLKVFFRKGLPVTGWRDLESIDLKYDKQVVTRNKTKA